MLTISHSLGPDTLLLANGYGGGKVGNGMATMELRKDFPTVEESRRLISTDHNFNSMRSPPSSGSTFVTF